MRPRGLQSLPDDLLGSLGEGPGSGTGSALVPAGGAAPAPAVAGGVQQELQLPLPEVFPIPGSQEFNPLGYTTTAVVQSNIIIPNASVQLPPYNIGIIRSVGLYLSNMSAATDVLWSLLFNGAPVVGYTNLTMFPRVLASAVSNFDTYIRIPQNTLVTAEFSNLDGGSYTVGLSFSGWYYPLPNATRWITFGYPPGA
jgi:hypothetical protein